MVAARIGAWAETDALCAESATAADAPAMSGIAAIANIEMTIFRPGGEAGGTARRQVPGPRFSERMSRQQVATARPPIHVNIKGSLNIPIRRRARTMTEYGLRVGVRLHDCVSSRRTIRASCRSATRVAATIWAILLLLFVLAPARAANGDFDDTPILIDSQRALPKRVRPSVVRERAVLVNMDPLQQCAETLAAPGADCRLQLDLFPDVSISPDG